MDARCLPIDTKIFYRLIYAKNPETRKDNNW